MAVAVLVVDDVAATVVVVERCDMIGCKKWQFIQLWLRLPDVISTCSCTINSTKVSHWGSANQTMEY